MPVRMRPSAEFYPDSEVQEYCHNGSKRLKSTKGRSPCICKQTSSQDAGKRQADVEEDEVNQSDHHAVRESQQDDNGEQQSKESEMMATEAQVAEVSNDGCEDEVVTIIISQSTDIRQVEQHDNRTAQVDRGSERNVREDYRRYVRFTVKQLESNQHYTLDLYKKLMSSIGKQPSLENYRKNLSAMLYIVAEHSHKIYLRDFSPRFDESRREFFTQFYQLPHFFHPA